MSGLRRVQRLHLSLKCCVTLNTVVAFSASLILPISHPADWELALLSKKFLVLIINITFYIQYMRHTSAATGAHSLALPSVILALPLSIGQYLSWSQVIILLVSFLSSSELLIPTQAPRRTILSFPDPSPPETLTRAQEFTSLSPLHFLLSNKQMGQLICNNQKL